MNIQLIKHDPIAIKLDEGVQTVDGRPQVPSDVQLLRTGLFSYFEPGDMEINQGHLLSMVNNFQKKIRGVDLAVDYGHDCYGEAAGWFENLFLSSDGNELWATIKWTPEGLEKLGHKEYRYISSEFSFQYEDTENKIEYGPTMFGAGLTNRPFVKNMEPLIAMSDKERKMTIEEMKKKLEEQEALVKRLNESLDSKEKKIKENEEAQAKAKAAAEKEASFNKMLSEGKVVEAQRSAFLDGDMIKFSELAGSVKFKEIGSEGKKVELADPSTKTAAQAEDEILELSKKKHEEFKGVKTLNECISLVLSENKLLAEKYQSKFSF